MYTNYYLEPVTAVFVDSAPAQCRNLCMFAGGQDRIRLCGVFDNGQALLEALYRGLRPHVLVIDQQLPDRNIFAVLRAIRMLEAGYLPHVILTIPVPLDANTYDLLLTSGVNSFMLKPYTLPRLFEEIFLVAAKPDAVTVYRIRAAYEEQMDRMYADKGLNGRRYLERMICDDLQAGQNRNLKELYHAAAQAENLSDNAVASGLKRLAEQLCAAGAPAYRQLCGENGKPTDRPLSNGVLFRCVADLIRRAVME